MYVSIIIVYMSSCRVSDRKLHSTIIIEWCWLWTCSKWCHLLWLSRVGEVSHFYLHTLQCTSDSLHSWSISFSCSSCTSRFNCNWCPVEFQCRTSGADCSQSPVVSVRAALVQCCVYLSPICNLELHLFMINLPLSKAGPPTFIYSPPPPQSTSSSCPRLLPALIGDGRYYLHEGLGPQDESLVLRGENLLIPVCDHSCNYKALPPKLF